MLTDDTQPERVFVQGTQRSSIENQLEQKLKRVYGRGIYVSDIYESQDESSLVVHLGNSFPKDVTDCRYDEYTIKLISIDNIHEIEAHAGDNGYSVELPPRHELQDGYEERKENIINKLDRSMARATYRKLARLPHVNNQLNAIEELLRWTRRDGPLDYNEIDQDIHQDKDTEKYVSVLGDLGFLKKEGCSIYPGERLDAYDLEDISIHQFNNEVMGEVINVGYNVLVTELNLTILKHYPRFSNAYYISAIERGDYEFWLDVEAIQDNLAEWYPTGKKYHKYEVKDKVEELAGIDILEEEDGFYRGKKDVYEAVAPAAPV